MYTALVKRLFVLVAILLICINTFGQKAYFKLAQEHIKVGIEDYFQVTYIIGNADNIDQFAPPDFTNFEHVAAPSQSQSNRKYIQNGNLTQEKSISVTYTLKPNKIGTFKFSPASVRIDNQKFTTNPITIEVVKGSLAPQTNPRRRHPLDDIFEQDPTVRPRSNRNNTQNPQVREFGRNNLKNNIFLRLESNNDQPYVGQGVQVYYKLYTRLPMNMQLAKLPKFDHFWVEDTPLPPDLKPEVKVINGKEYNVFTIKQATIYPQKAGIFNLESVKAEGIVRVLEETNMRDPFEDDFFSDFFGENPFSDFFGSGIQMVDIPLTLQSTEKTIHVKPIPNTDSNSQFSGIGIYNLSEDFPTTSITTDDAAQWHITLRGRGNFSQLQLPDTLYHEHVYIILSNSTDSITQRQPELFGYKTFTYNIIPKNIGSIDIPSQTFTFFNTDKGDFYTLTTSSHQLQITKGEGSHLQFAEDNLHITALKPITNNINYIDIIKYIIYLLIVVNIILYFIYKFEILEHWKKSKSQDKMNKIAINRLVIAKNHLDQNNFNNFYIEINKALLLYIHDKFNMPLSDMNLESIKNLFNHIQLAAAQQEQFEHLYQYSNQALYMPNASVDAQYIYDSTVQWITLMERKLQTSKKGYVNLFLFLIILLTSNNLTIAQGMDSLYNQKQYKAALEQAYLDKSALETNADFSYNMGLIHQQLSHEDSAQYYFKNSFKYKKTPEAYLQIHHNLTLFHLYIGLSIFLLILLCGLLVLFILKLNHKAIPYQNIIFKTTLMLSVVTLVLFLILEFQIFS